MQWKQGEKGRKEESQQTKRECTDQEEVNQVKKKKRKEKSADKYWVPDNARQAERERKGTRRDFAPPRSLRLVFIVHKQGPTDIK